MPYIQLSVTTAAGIVADHNLLAHDPAPAPSLLVILPGRGYTVEQPLLYYLRMMAFAAGYDVLSVQYSFHAAPHLVKPDALGEHDLIAETGQVLELMLARGYRRLCLAGKSLGTPVAVAHARNCPFEMTGLILLTPIHGCVRETGDLPTLAVIGTGDPYYQPDEIAAATANVTWRVYAGLNHGLEAEDDWAASITRLGEIIGDCAQFLRTLEA